MSSTLPLRLALAFAALLIAAAIGHFGYRAWRADPFAGENPLTASDAVDGRIGLIDSGFSLNGLPSGWVHKTFFNIRPTDYAFENVDDRFVLHCATNAGGSILARNMAAPLDTFPVLTWDWKIDQPLESTVDEATKAGDDHPARLFLRFQGEDGTKSAAEIIWSNKKYGPADYKIIGGFHHLVANGRNENAGVWHAQSVDLLRLYRDVSGRTDRPVLTVLGFFCDSDNTGGRTSAYFANLALSAAGASP